MSSMVITIPNREVTRVGRSSGGRVFVEIDHTAVIYLTQADLDKIAPFITKEAKP